MASHYLLTRCFQSKFIASDADSRGTDAVNCRGLAVDRSAVLFLDRAKTTCASALIAGDLADIKALCCNVIFKTPYPLWNYSLI